MHHHADVAVAVAIEGGLITPIVRAAENRSRWPHISEEMKDLAARARDAQAGARASSRAAPSRSSNLGMFGIKNFASIINEPAGHASCSVGAGEATPGGQERPARHRHA